MSKLGILLGAGVGYVLGARAGRASYDKIEQQARRLWSNPRVQKAKEQAGDVAQEKGAQVQQKVKDAAGGAQEGDPLESPLDPGTTTTTFSTTSRFDGTQGGGAQGE